MIFCKIILFIVRINIKFSLSRNFNQISNLRLLNKENVITLQTHCAKITLMTSDNKPTVVGALACQRDSFLFKGFETEVVSCNENKSKDKPKYEIELKDTILFPEGGGQPSDSGFLKIVKTDGEDELIPVPFILRKGLHAMHHVDVEIQPGTKVEVIVDELKRVDYMQQHSGQHLLSAILETSDFNAKTVGWSMGGIPTSKKPILEPSDYFNYIEIDRKLSVEDITRASKIVNDIISMKPLPISVVERTPDMQDGVDSSKVPEDYDLEKGILRTIHIGEIDSNPCCGTHLNSTSQIESILILPNQTSVRGTNSRLYFMCGNRVRDYAQQTNEIISTVKSLLSCNESSIDEKITKLKEQVHQSGKREQFWIKELASYETAKIMNSLNKNGKAYLLKDEFGSLEFLLQVFKELSPQLKIFDKPYQIVLCGREGVQTGNPVGSLIILSESGETIANISKKLSALLANMKGGGGKNGGKWQGKITKFTDIEWEALTIHLEKFNTE